VILVLKSFEIGQPVSAASAAFRNASCEAPGTFATSSRCDSVMPQPPSTLSRVTVQVVRRLAGTRFALPSSADSAIVKQPACAAATSSSGLEPLTPSNRVENE
jgi:hypothetical protein